MLSQQIPSLLVALLPVLAFLCGLLYFDSYKLVSLRRVLAVILAGGLCCAGSYFLNGLVRENLGLTTPVLSRYAAPVIEEFLKALIIVYFLSRNRIGFMVDAAIYGFAVGSGFSIIENLYYLQMYTDSSMTVWVVRGFGTAIMHGGVAAIFAVIAHSLSGTHDKLQALDLLPGLLLAILTHSVYNHFFLNPIFSTLLITLLLPAVAYVVVRQSEQQVSQWLGLGFDEDAELLELINSGEFSSSPVGQYLHSLCEYFSGETVVDILCYLRLQKELSLRAKGMLMMRENGFKVEIEPNVREVLIEMKALQENIGKTGQAAIKPFLRLSRKDLWQIYLLE
jgi:RsiW-degrading membrane proteinase PrsW (M82 family)